MRAGFKAIVTTRSVAAAAVLLVASCGIDQGGYRDPIVANNPPPPQLVLVSGPIEAFGSVHVNGLKLDTAHAQIRIDGNAAAQAELRLGQMIRAVALVESASTAALSIDYADNVVGPVAALDVNLGELTVLGQRVRVMATTRFDGAGLAALRDVQPGDRVAVSGIALPSGGVLATFIGRAASSAPLKVTTPITGLASAGLKFDLGGLTVDYSRAVLLDVPGGIPAPNLVVEVTGTTVTNGELLAERVRALPLVPGAFTAAATALTGAEVPAAALAPATAAQPTAANFVGVISARSAPAALTLLDLQVLLTGTTTVVGGTADDLAPGTRIRVEARILGPGQVEATLITIL
jgi:dihydroxyacetone kinase DhaKLM complex PTS-EIIA-like component DhaM